MSKMKKIMIRLMLLVTLVSSFGQPALSFAETINGEASQEIINQSSEVKEIEQDSEANKVELNGEMNQNNSNYNLESEIGESQNANDSPNLKIATPLSEKEIQQKIDEMLADNGYSMVNGQLRSITGTSYRGNLFEVIEKISQIRTQNQHQIQAFLQDFSPFMSTDVIYVDQNYGSSTIGWSQSNGNVELGYYSKKDASGVMLWCVEPGAPLSWGENGGYTSNSTTEAKYVKASLVAYWGFDQQKSVVNAFYTEKLIQESVTGVTTSGIYDSSGIASQEGYEAFKNDTLNKVDKFYTAPSFINQPIELKAGESITLTDTNGSLQYFKVTANTANVVTEQNGNTLKITASNNSNETGNLRLRYQIDPEYEGAAIVYTAEWIQDVMRARVGDPIAYTVPVKVIKLGNAEFQKVSEFSNLPMAGVTYKVKEDGKNEYTMQTDSEGKLSFKDRLHASNIYVTEIKNPIGWVIDPTTYKLTIEGGTTVSKKLINEIQMGRFKGIKEQKVLDIEATKKEEKPVYKKIPLAGAIFDVIAKNDIMLPDGKTVYVKAGTVVDTVTTDANGYFESTKDLLDGENNKYQLIEKNVPEGFRPPSEVQSNFSIPYGENTEKLITYDLGSIDNDVQTGKLKFFKRDSLTLLGIDGAQFTVEMMSGIYAGTFFKFTTNMLGNEFELPVGEWRLTEIKLPNGYLFDESTPQTQWVTIVDNETIELNWSNKKLLPEIEIGTQAHTGDGKTNSFEWGENVKPHDDVKIGHKNIAVGAERAFEAILVAVYPNGEEKDVWSSGKIDYKVTDEQITKTVIAEYDYKKDPKGTRYFFKEVGYNKPSEKEYKVDKKHNFDGKERTQDWTPKETPAKQATATTPQKSSVASLPKMGESTSLISVFFGLIIIVALAGYFLLTRKKQEQK